MRQMKQVFPVEEEGLSSTQLDDQSDKAAPNLLANCEDLSDDVSTNDEERGENEEN
jgi:hypothetical protein